VSNPFFLTRQTANLMEDFLRELKSATSLYFLYGDSGVGKTRLMRELSRNRMPDARIRWVNLSPDGSGEESSEAGSAAIEAIFSSAQSGDIIIADQFETALKKTRHQLFLSWSTDGVDKQVHLVIASGSEGFNELRQLSQQYQVRVKSFQLMPFSADEVEAFLGFYLFPEHPVDKLSMPAALRKQFAATQGVVGKIIEIADNVNKSDFGPTPSKFTCPFCPYRKICDKAEL
jgi:AAA+ ATPase superfamily predicted ATPase